MGTFDFHPFTGTETSSVVFPFCLKGFNWVPGPTFFCVQANVREFKFLNANDAPCGSAGKESTCNAGDVGLVPGLGRSPGEGKGYPLQYSGLENSMDGSGCRKESDMTEGLSLMTSVGQSSVKGKPSKGLLIRDKSWITWRTEDIKLN